MNTTYVTDDEYLESFLKRRAIRAKYVQESRSKSTEAIALASLAFADGLHLPAVSGNLPLVALILKTTYPDRELVKSVIKAVERVCSDCPVLDLLLTFSSPSALARCAWKPQLKKEEWKCCLYKIKIYEVLCITTEFTFDFFIAHHARALCLKTSTKKGQLKRKNGNVEERAQL